MEKDIPLKIEILSSDQDDQYCITSAREIEFVLQSIAKGTSRIALYYSDADDFILTMLLDVDASGLWLEQSQKADVNQRILESKKLIFVSSHNQVKVQFIASLPRATTFQGRPAFFLALPKSIHRLQRREYFRLATPVSDPLLCVIPNEQAEEHHKREVTIMDISGGGVGLTCAEQEAVLVPGQTYHDCLIDLRDIGDFYATIEVKNLVLLSTESGETVRRAGCEFKNLDGTSTNMLQRYVTAMQRTKLQD